MKNFHSLSLHPSLAHTLALSATLHQSLALAASIVASLTLIFQDFSVMDSVVSTRVKKVNPFVQSLVFMCLMVPMTQ